MSSSDYDGVERRDLSLNEEIRELRQGTVGLAERVEALSRDFTIVNELTARQQEIEKTSAEAVVAAAKAIAAAKEAKESTIPRDELEKQDSERLALLAEYRQRVLGRVYAASILAVFLIAVAAVLAANYVSAQHQRDYDQCVAGQGTTKVVGNYLKVVSDNSTNPVIKKAAQDVVDVLAPAGTRDCEALK